VAQRTWAGAGGGGGSGSVAVNGQMAYPIVNCDVAGWGFSLISYLGAQMEVDLVNCDLLAFAELCHGMATKFSMRLDVDLRAQAVRFRRVWD
jgi:hypothetical protein